MGGAGDLPENANASVVGLDCVALKKEEQIAPEILNAEILQNEYA